MNDSNWQVVAWIKDDWNSDRKRFAIEILAWVISIGCSLTMAFTVPNPPLFFLYPTWICGCALYAWAAYSRRSFGMLANYMLLVIIDIIGLTRMVMEII